MRPGVLEQKLGARSQFGATGLWLRAQIQIEGEPDISRNARRLTLCEKNNSDMAGSRADLSWDNSTLDGNIPARIAPSGRAPHNGTNCIP